MRVQVRCTNPHCEQVDRVKNVALCHLGNGIYLVGSMICGICKTTVKLVSE